MKPEKSRSQRGTPSQVKLSKESFSSETFRLFNNKGYQSIKSEYELRASGFLIFRSKSFTKDFEFLQHDDYIRAKTVPKSKASSINSTSSHSALASNNCLVKVFLLTRIPYRHRNMLLNESSRMMRFFSEEKTCPASIHKALDVFVVDKAKMYIFYEDLPLCKPLSYLTTKGTLPSASICKWFGELATAIDYLHHFGVSHRYIRAEYLFITAESKIKLTHFELACFIWNPNETKQVPRNKGMQDDLVEQWNHLPPEVWNDKYDAFGVDIWSFGVCLLFACTGKYLFKAPVVLGECLQLWKAAKADLPAQYKPYLSALDKVFQPVEGRLTSKHLVEELKSTLKVIRNVSSRRFK